MDSYTGLWPYDHEEVAEGLYVLKPVYEPIYTVNNLYNAFIVLFFYVFTWNLVLFTGCIRRVSQSFFIAR